MKRGFDDKRSSNPFNAKATFTQKIRMQKILNTI